ncbi:MAG: hypothetical protein KGO82_07220, partial [Bacteroidota bacterium]|nr:hypothetical protein [Bacteroidota bacterium]
SCLSKIWVHRVNSTERLKWVKRKFSGVEADIMFDSAAGCFWVCHPPEKSALRLEEYLQELQTEKPCSAWLDMRGVTSRNAARAVSILSELGKKADIRNRLVYEVYDIDAANFIATNGFTTSFHVPATAFADSAALTAFDRALAPAVEYVSQESSFVGKMKNGFRNRKIITWSIAFSNYFDRRNLEGLLADPSIAVVLVNVKSRGYK